MNRSDYRFLNRSRFTALALVMGGALGLLAACSSDDDNPAPSNPPPITTGGGGNANGEGGEAGAVTNGGTVNQGGRSNGGGSGPVSEGGEGGEGGAGPNLPVCPATTDEGFLNAPSPSTTLKSHFDNTRLGVHDSLPELPH